VHLRLIYGRKSTALRARLVGWAGILHHWRSETGTHARRERATGKFWPIVWQPVLHRLEQKCILFGCLDTALHLCSVTTHVFGCHFGYPGKSFSSPHSNMVTLPSHNGTQELKHDHKHNTQLYTTNRVLSS
jgi:hypothetical protein